MALTLTVSLADQDFAKTKTIGILNVSLGLCRALSGHAGLSRMTLLANPSLPQIGELGRVRRLDIPGIERFRRFWWDQVGVYNAVRKTGNDWLLLPKGYASFLRRCPVKLATYVHDAMQEHYRVHHPTAYPGFEGFYFRACLKASVRKSRVVLVNSQFTADEIKRFAQAYGITAPPIVPVGIGFDRPAKPASETPRNRILVLASRWPHKRTDLAMQYLRRWQEQHQHSGPVDWVGSLPNDMDFPGLKNWRLYGRLDPGEYDRLMGESSALVYFSEYEGFGMPPVEAILAGACPVYSSIPATEEVMRGMGCSFRNESYESFAAALVQALKTSGQQISDWAEHLLAKYTWDAVAERTIDAMEGIARSMP